MNAHAASLRLAIACLVLVVLSGVSPLMQSSDRWYEAYDNGLDALGVGDLDTARAKFSEALSKGPDQGARVRFYGTIFRSYFPEYYLGLIATRQGRLDEAEARYLAVTAQGLDPVSDEEFRELPSLLVTELVARAQRAVEQVDRLPPREQAAGYEDAVRQAARALNIDGTSAGARDVRAQAAAALADINDRLTQFDGLVADARTALFRDQFVEARRAVDAAATLNINDGLLTSLLGEIDVAELAQLEDRVAAALAQQEFERARGLIPGVQAFDPTRASALATSIDQAQLEWIRAAVVRALGEQGFQTARALAADAGAIDRGTANELLSLVETASETEFSSRVEVALTALAAGRATEARAAAEGARGLVDDQTPVDEVLARVGQLEAARTAFENAVVAGRSDDAQTSLETVVGIAPGSSELAGLTARFNLLLGNLDRAQQVREGLRAFYVGDYAGAISVLESLVDASPPSDRALLYTASSLAAQALLSADTGNDGLTGARALYQRAVGGETDFSSDRRFISPAILEALAQ
jgi:tetratricopeptide (TPR) repeat protein